MENLEELKKESVKVFHQIKELEYKVMSLSEYEILLVLYRKNMELNRKIESIQQKEGKNGK